MKNIKVLGSGCRNCEITANAIAQAAKEAGVEIELEKVSDMAEILSYGVMSTPGVVVDGQLVLSHAFNAIVTDGGFGLLSNAGQTSFDAVTFQTDDPAYSGDAFPDVFAVRDQSSYYWEDYSYIDEDWGEPTP